MTKTKPTVAPVDNGPVIPGGIPMATGFIVTKADKTMWAACVTRMRMQASGRHVRYFHIAAHGITAVMKDGQEVSAEWVMPYRPDLNR